MDTRIKSGFFVCAAGLGSSKKRCCSVKVYNDFFGEYGGRYVAEVLRSPLLELETAFCDAMADSTYLADLAAFGKDYVGRPTPLLYAENASAEIGGGQIYIKLEGLANTGAHKVNNVIGQALLAKRMGKTRIIAETGAGQHGLATAAVCAKMGLDCTVYMGEVDIARQRPNVFWMEMFGAKIVPVSSGARTLKDAVNEALRDWSSSFSNTHYLLGSALGPSPYPDMVREFQAVIGRETAAQLTAAGVEAEALVACVGGGSNSIGFFEPYLETDSPRLVGVEAGGLSLQDRDVYDLVESIHVAHGEDVGLGCAHLLVHENPLALDLHTSRFQVEAIDIRSPTQRLQNDVGTDLMILSFMGEADTTTLTISPEAVQLGAGEHLHALFAHVGLHGPSQILVHTRQDVVRSLDEGHIHADTTVELRQFAGD